MQSSLCAWNAPNARLIWRLWVLWMLWIFWMRSTLCIDCDFIRILYNFLVKLYEIICIFRHSRKFYSACDLELNLWSALHFTFWCSQMSFVFELKRFSKTQSCIFDTCGWKNFNTTVSSTGNTYLLTVLGKEMRLN